MDASLTDTDVTFAAELDVEDGPKEEEKFIQHRIFINNVDSFLAKHFASFITDQIYGALRIGSGGGEEGEPEETQLPLAALVSSNHYEVVGTRQNKFGTVTEDITKVISKEDNEECYKNELLRCAFVIFDIGHDSNQIPEALEALNIIDEEVQAVQRVGPKTFARYGTMKVFILLSTCMTWASTKPIDPEDPETPFNESDYRKRKPHPNYTDHIALEREVVMRGKKYKDYLRTYVVCCGIVYGHEEDDLHCLFRMAWNNENRMPIFYPGTNKIPLIHVQDLTKVLLALMERLPKKPQYMLAVEQLPCNLRQIIKAIAENLGRNKIIEVSNAEAFLYKNITQHNYERFTVNLNMEPGSIVEDLELEYKSDLNLVENMPAIVTEFRDACKLIPKKIFMHGPPASGKTTVALHLADIYGLHYVTVESAIRESVEDLHDDIENAKAIIQAREERAPMQAARDEFDEEDIEEEEEEEEVPDVEEMQERLTELELAMEEATSSNTHIPDELAIRILKQFLATNICQNQGYILDGFPETMAQAQALFGAHHGGVLGDGEEEGEGEEGGGSLLPSKIIPITVISLESTDEFICERIMRLSEEEIQGTDNEEERLLHRLEAYRLNNTEDNTILNYFNELEIHPVVFNVMMDEMEPVHKQMYQLCGPVVGFAKTPAELEEEDRCRREVATLRAEQEALVKQMRELQLINDHRDKMEKWTQMLELYQSEEEKQIIAQSEPLRNYLMKYVFPTLTEGLLEVAKIKPDDPVDFLAEYLFKVNPEGKMFDPAYSRNGEYLVEQFKAETKD